MVRWFLSVGWSLWFRSGWTRRFTGRGLVFTCLSVLMADNECPDLVLDLSIHDFRAWLISIHSLVQGGCPWYGAIAGVSFLAGQFAHSDIDHLVFSPGPDFVGEVFTAGGFRFGVILV